MKITYDEDVKTAYIYLVDHIRPGEAYHTIECGKGILLDFNKNWKLLGIEILNAKDRLAAEVLKQAEDITYTTQ